MNKTTLHGNVGSDPAMRKLESGKTVASFSLATTRSYKDKDGNKATDWHKIIVWGKTAELCEKYVKKGSSLIIEGEIQYRKYTDKDGIERNITEIVCSELHFAGSVKKDDAAKPAPEKQSPQVKQDEPPFDSSIPDDLSDLPF